MVQVDVARRLRQSTPPEMDDFRPEKKVDY